MKHNKIFFFKSFLLLFFCGSMTIHALDFLKKTISGGTDIVSASLTAVPKFNNAITNFKTMKEASNCLKSISNKNNKGVPSASCTNIQCKEKSTCILTILRLLALGLEDFTKGIFGQDNKGLLPLVGKMAGEKIQKTILDISPLMLLATTIFSQLTESLQPVQSKDKNGDVVQLLKITDINLGDIIEETSEPEKTSAEQKEEEEVIVAPKKKTAAPKKKTVVEVTEEEETEEEAPPVKSVTKKTTTQTKEETKPVVKAAPKKK